MFSLMASQTLTRVKAMARSSRRVISAPHPPFGHLLPASGEKALEQPRSQFPIHRHRRAARCLWVVVPNAVDSAGWREEEVAVAAGKHALVVQDVVQLQRELGRTPDTNRHIAIQ